jgi:hypothetical protein
VQPHPELENGHDLSSLRCGSADEVCRFLNRGEDFARIAEGTAMRASVSSGQVALYVQAMIAAWENVQRQQ